MNDITAPFPANGQEPWGDDLRAWGTQVEDVINVGRLSAEKVGGVVPGFWTLPSGVMLAGGGNGPGSAGVAARSYPSDLVVDRIAIKGYGVDPRMTWVFYAPDATGAPGELIASGDITLGLDAAGWVWTIQDLPEPIHLPSFVYAGGWWKAGGGSIITAASSTGSSVIPQYISDAAVANPANDGNPGLTSNYSTTMADPEAPAPQTWPSATLASLVTAPVILVHTV